MRADGFLDGPDVQSATGISYVENAVPFNWDAVPACGRQLFGTHMPEPPSERGMREMLPGVDAFFIIHEDQNAMRKTRLESILQSSRQGDPAGLAPLATWVTWFNEDDLRRIPVHEAACVFNQTYAEPLFTAALGSPLSRNLKHLWVYHEMLRRQLRNVLVMEDNAVFRGGVDDAVQSLQALMGALPSEDRIVMLGDADMAQGHPWREKEIESSFMEAHANQKVSQHLYGPGLGQRGASGYLISAKSAASILQYVYNGFKVDAEADTFMENALGPEGFYWYEPPLWVQSDSPLKVDLETSAPSGSGKASQSVGTSRSSAEDNLLQESVGTAPGSSGARASENATNHQWSRYHRHLGTSGYDDPYHGARERHMELHADGTRHLPRE